MLVETGAVRDKAALCGLYIAVQRGQKPVDVIELSTCVAAPRFTEHPLVRGQIAPRLAAVLAAQSGAALQQARVHFVRFNSQRVAVHDDVAMAKQKPIDDVCQVAGDLPHPRS